MAEPTAVEDAGVAFVSPLPQEVTLRHFELWQQSVAEERPVVELEAQAVDPGVGESDTPASYSLTIIGRERKRLLADLTEFLSDEGLETVSARIFTLPNESIMDMFQLRDPTRVLSDDTCTSRVYNTLVRLAGGGGDAGPAAADSPAGQATRGMGGKSRSNTKHVGSSSGASSAGAGPGMASLASATSAAGAASDSVHASDSLDEIARRANSNTGHEVSRIRRCASNIAVIDLAATLERQDSEQASHHHRAPVYTPDMLKMLPASPSNQALSSRAAGSRSGYPPGYPPIDFDVLVAGEWLYYYSSKSGNRYRYKFRLSSDHQFLLWEGRSLRLATCIGVVFGPKSSTFLKLDEKNDRVDQDWLCFSVVSFPREGKNDGNPTTVDVACETDDQLATWLFGLQRLCGAAPEVRGGNDPYSYEAILRQRFMYKLSTRAHDRGLTVRQYFLKKVRKYGARVGRESQLGQRDEEVAALERDIEVLRKQVRQANAREAVLATKLHTLQADWDIDFSEVSLSHTIGRGAYSEMWRGVWRGCAVAVKVLKGPDSASPTGAAASAAVGADHTGEALDAEGSHEHRHLHDFHDEVVVLSKLRHPNIVLFMAACAHPPNLCIVTEFCHGGNLFNALRRPSWRAEIGHSQMLSMTRDAARGMHYLHKGNMIHRDLKSQNILLDRPVEHGCPVLKIADFGLSRDFQNGSTRQSRGLEDSVAAVMTSETGTYRYMSPNVIRHEPYNAKADVYSFAVTLWEMFSCEIPFSGMTPIQAAFAVADKGLRPSAVSEQARDNPIPPAWQVLIEHCWHDDPHMRPSFADILVILDEMEKHGPVIQSPFWANWKARRARPTTLRSLDVSPKPQENARGPNGGIGTAVPQSVNDGHPGGVGQPMPDWVSISGPTGRPGPAQPRDGESQTLNVRTGMLHSGSAPNLKGLNMNSGRG